MVGDNQREKELSEAYKKIGRLLSENLGAGISEGADAAVDAMEQINTDLLATQQQYLNEKTRIEQETAAAEEEKSRRDYQNRLKKAKTAEQAEIVRQNERLRLQKKANAEYLEALESHLKTVEARIKEQKESIVREFNDIAQRTAESLEELTYAENKMAQKMVKFGGLFNSKTITILNSGPNESKEVFEETILDLSKERKELETYAALLQEVQKRMDIPSELFQAIRDLSVEDAIRYQEALLALDDEKLADYLEDWEAIQRLSDETTKISYAQEVRAVLDMAEEELADWYGTIPENFFEEGRLSAEAFGEGFVEKLKSMQSILEAAVQSVITVEALQSPYMQSTEEASGVQNVQNTVTYVLNSAGETVAQQLRSVRSHAEITKLREG